jgi:isoquinoline 1-oxidoreductase beta subunit
VGTQGQTSAQDAAATAAGIPADKVRIHTTYLGGGFGRRAETDMVIEAVTLAKALGKPVQVSWSREEDMQHDTYRPAVLGRMTGTLGPDGMPLAIRHRLAGQSILARLFPPATWMGPDPTQFEGTAHLPYAIPNQIVEVATLDLPVRVGAWRSVGHSFAGFFKECFLDELAAAGGRDPVEFRRRLLAEHPRALAVLDLAASNGGWGSPLAPGEGRGVALHISFASIVAQIVEVAVDPKGGLKIKRVVAAVDCGTVINPNVVEAQIQGAIAYGLSAALYGKITLAKGRVEQANFPDYDVVRLAGMPPVEVHLIGSDGPPGGVGEPGLPPVAPALVNAIFAATGKRIRTLPLVDQGFTV